MLTKAGTLSRTRDTDEVRPEELKAASAKPLGPQKFRLSNLDDFKPGFDPKSLKDQKVLAKGVLNRSSAGDRIFVLSLDAVSNSCN
jgi:hypothetical protein